MNEEKFINYFEEIKKFKIEQQKQKQRGLNDFNLLTTVRNYHDEVYLHSSIIGSLLNPRGKHYQDTLFLEKFFKMLNLKDFEFDLSNITVKIEYKNIDLYITDGNKHIILENKIWAEDQPCQLIKYINIIKEENDLSVDNSEIPKIEDMYVLYLTSNNKKTPYEHIMHGEYIFFSGSESKLNECSKKANTKNFVPLGLKNYQVKYKKISYKNDILEWLYMCIKEVKNITNLNEAIKQYIDVVKMLNNNYKGKVMGLKNLLFKDENLKLAIKDIQPAILESKIEIQTQFWYELREQLNKKDIYNFEFVNQKFHPIDIDSCVKDYYKMSKNNKNFGLKYDLVQIDDIHTLSFFIEINWNIYFGFTIKGKDERKSIAQNEKFAELSNRILNFHQFQWNSTNKEKDQQWWICWKYPQKKLDFYSFDSNNIFDLVDSNKRKEIILNIVHEIDQVITSFMEN